MDVYTEEGMRNAIDACLNRLEGLRADPKALDECLDRLEGLRAELRNILSLESVVTCPLCGSRARMLAASPVDLPKFLPHGLACRGAGLTYEAALAAAQQTWRSE